MAKAGTKKWESGHFYSAGKCNGCGAEKEEGITGFWHRLFYYPTVFNGDAELEMELCDSCFKKKHHGA